MEKKFKVGDVVVWHEDKGEIIGIDENDNILPYLVAFPNEKDFWLPENELTLKQNN